MQSVAFFCKTNLPRVGFFYVLSELFGDLECDSLLTMPSRVGLVQQSLEPPDTVHGIVEVRMRKDWALLNSH